MEIFNWQLNQLFSITSLVHFISCSILIYFIGNLILGKLNKKFPIIDGRIHPHEKKFYESAFIRYFLWGSMQQIIVLSLIYLLDIGSPLVNTIAAIILFSILFHLPNWKLMIATFFLALLIYPTYYFYNIQSIIFIGLLHGIGGTYYKYTQWGMKVWRFK